MAFIPIHAKADIENSKKGRLTPSQCAQLNAWCLTKKTGILDCLNKCKAVTENITNVSGNEATVVFKSGYLVICGRLVEVEENTTIVVPTPVTGSVKGKIVAGFNLSLSKEKEFSVYTKQGDLIKNDLNLDGYKNTGVFEFELYSYTATPTTVTLERKEEEYVKSVEKRLEELGFNYASVSSGGISLNADWTGAVPSYNLGSVISRSDPYIYVEKIGKLAHIDKLKVATYKSATGSGTNSLNISGNITTLPEIFRPLNPITVYGYVTYIKTDSIFGRVATNVMATINVNTDGVISVSASANSTSAILISSEYPVIVTILNAGWKIP